MGSYFEKCDASLSLGCEYEMTNVWYCILCFLPLCPGSLLPWVPGIVAPLPHLTGKHIWDCDRIIKITALTFSCQPVDSRECGFICHMHFCYPTGFCDGFPILTAISIYVCIGCTFQKNSELKFGQSLKKRPVQAPGVSHLWGRLKSEGLGPENR